MTELRHAGGVRPSIMAALPQSKTRDRVRNLAEVYTQQREVEAMLDLVPDMFPSADRPRDIGRTFLEPACGAGNFLVAILDRKLSHVTYGGLYRRIETFEVAVLQALSSIYGIDIDQENVDQSRQFLRADLAHHTNLQLNGAAVTGGFWPAVDTILDTNIIWADTLTDAQDIRLIEYHWQQRSGYVIREWSYLEEPDAQPDLFTDTSDEPLQDAVAIHYGQLADHSGPVAAKYPRAGVSK